MIATREQILKAQHITNVQRGDITKAYTISGPLGVADWLQAFAANLREEQHKQLEQQKLVLKQAAELANQQVALPTQT
jgi:hypothetical protein